MKRKTKIILSVIAVLFIGGLVSAFLLWNKPHINVKDADAIKVSADSLYDALSKDSVSAKTNYINKIVEVEGAIGGVDTNKQNQQVIHLNTRFPNAYINCTMESEMENLEWDHIITVKGICNGLNSGDADLGIPGDVILIRCYASN